jgi:hypothetical protein
VQLHDASEVQAVLAELQADPLFGFEALCDYVEDAADGSVPLPSHGLPASLAPKSSNGPAGTSSFLAAAAASLPRLLGLPHGQLRDGNTNQGWMRAGSVPAMLRPLNVE